MRLSHLFRPRHVVVSSLAGGLGNQLFQYAIGRATALQHRCELVLDTRILQIKTGHTPRDFALGDFRIEASVDTLTPAMLDRCIAIQEKNAGFDASVERRTRPGCRLTGYWQTARYFQHIRPRLLQELSLRDPVSDYIGRTANQIRAGRSASVHFRRGDYVSDPQVAAYHGTCGPGYYDAAIKLLRSRHDGLHFFLFSDDPQWLADNIPPAIAGSAVTIIDASQSSAREDLWLMSLCEHHIIANSSFSWWGAWLSPHSGQNIAPARWFQTQAVDDKDIIPAHWTRI